jgi:hypothetical protein
LNVKDVWINPNGVIAMRVTLASLLVGGLWVGYLNWFAGPFPPDILRYMPLIWLTSADLAYECLCGVGSGATGGPG